MATEIEFPPKAKPEPDIGSTDMKTAKLIEQHSSTDYTQLVAAAQRLRFPSAVEAEFIADYYKNTILTTRMAFTAGMILYGLFGILDIYVAPYSLHYVWMIRFGIGCPALLVALLFTFSGRFASIIQLVGSIAAVIAGLGLILMLQATRLNELANTHYYVGILLVMLFTSAWLRLRFWYALITNTIIVISYEVVAIYIQHLLIRPEGQLLFLNNNFFILSAYVIAAFTNYSLERHTRMDFLQRRIIEAEKNKVNDQRQAIEQQAHKLSKVVASLKKTQARLVHSEKLASLGELTAGIAHEIKNPLNFVTNFSEVSMELLNDLETEIATGNQEEIIDLAKSIKENLQKIVFHGNRADSIVKNMLQHSRKGTGQKEPTDINALVDEYLRLSYQGLRARDKNFNAVMETHFDSSIGKINIVAQDIGRVLLNLFTNAFYSVNEKKKVAGNDYKPTIMVSTEKKDSFIVVRVKDNGLGITPKAMTKIFQPFFTTKPSGQGVGLGLSLSHDIVTKGHGGVMNVSTREGEFAEFVIQIPV